jgi:hypothetical protein
MEDGFFPPRPSLIPLAGLSAYGQFRVKHALAPN